MWRSSPLPKDWEQRKRRRFEADGYQCTEILANGKRCAGDGTLECDHIGDPKDHRHEMLRTMCGWHHHRKTSAQANACRKRVTQRRPKEPHPGVKP